MGRRALSKWRAFTAVARCGGKIFSHSICLEAVRIHHIVRNSRSALARDTLFENFVPEIRCWTSKSETVSVAKSGHYQIIDALENKTVVRPRGAT